MTSVDSGVETGNDSNDSSVTHENNITANSNTTAVAVTASINNTNNGNLSGTDVGSSRPLGIPITSICPSLTGLSDEQGASLPSTSGRLVLNPHAEPPKLLAWFRVPSIELWRHDDETSNHLAKSLKMRSAMRKKIRLYDPPGSYRHRRCWLPPLEGPLNERKMRLAAATNNIEMISRILANGVSPNNRDDQGRSPLHIAASRGYTEVVRLLLEHGADPNQRDCLGNTPLHLAVVTSKIAVVTLLLKAGTDVLSLDQHGHNPLQLAQTKLKLLQNYECSDMNRVKEEVHNVIGMLLAYLQRQKDAREQVEALSTFCSRLSLSNTSDQIQGDVRDLLANIDSLSLAS
ncbi:ankyrin repeat domain-containing protein 54-like [Athalia rosae]|uniref:ankyrin repeat domain-containing protein 54-like n=1 Tax=Athalia rosae TaxID=37344 RepID=UPI0006269AD3|nr:ankyrin repeat domain-containing protein 54-like [Athalia rosae]